MKWAVITLRSLLGLLLLFASVAYLFKLVTPPPTEGAMKSFNEGLTAARYLLPTAKVVELLCGLAFLTGRFVPLACVLFAPLAVNILGINLFLNPQGLPLALFVVLVTAFLAWHHRERYRPLFRS
jgi:uncharacterized membrane protein YphA (DoxX/SURF4 family)